MSRQELAEILKEKGLKVTPQRLAVLDALKSSEGHPTAEKLIEAIHENNPNIAIGTIYKILEAFIEKQIIARVYSDGDVMRYDAHLDHHHHHLYSVDSNKIEDYYDEDLNKLLYEYFKNKDIPGFSIDDIQLQIKGKFIKQ